MQAAQYIEEYNRIMLAKAIVPYNNTSGNTTGESTPSTTSSSSSSGTQLSLLPNNNPNSPISGAIVYHGIYGVTPGPKVDANKKAANKTMTMNEKLAHRDDPELSPLHRYAIGCTIAEHHLLDSRYDDIINQFPVDTSAETLEKVNKQPRRPLPQEIVSKKLNDTRNPLPEELLKLEYKKDTLQIEGKAKEQEEEKVADHEDVQPPPLFTYTIQPGDTLVGISMRFNAPIEELKKHNYLPHGYNVYHLKTMQIPTNGKPVPKLLMPPPSKADQLKEFKRKAGDACTLEEAKFYMEAANYNEDTALEEFKEDRRWAANSTVQFRPSVKTATIPNRNVRTKKP